MFHRKSFFANTIEAALAAARQELGDDTLLLDARPAKLENRALGAYEVLVELPESADAPSPHLSSPIALDPLLSDLAGLRKDLCKLTGLVTRIASRDAASVSTHLHDLVTHLEHTEAPSSFIAELMSRIERRLAASPAPPDSPAAWRCLTAELIDTFTTAPAETQPDVDSKSCRALVGPPGAGKTTLLMKLAASLALDEKRACAIISVDTYRIAAVDQLRAYASIFGLPLLVAETAGAFARCIDELASRDAVLIDTPGFGPRESPLAGQWGEAFRRVPALHSTLVLPATSRYTDLLDVMQRFAPFQPRSLALSRMDETASFGPALAAAAAAGVPVDCFSTGQSIPEDMETATPGKLAALLAGKRTGLAASAA